ncbi:MAG: DegT/DnrJ/EryC1/StrS family aminotransferase [Candidatus Margulisiibacteriota bacterium]|jgi:perosamine synthetase
MEFFNTHISKKSIELANKVLNSTFVSAGKIADQFEKELTNKLGIINPVSVNSSTSALHLGLTVANVGPGDEVILPAQTFIASGMTILLRGAKPVFADIQLETGNISPQSIKEKITERTKVIMPVHWAGYPCDLDEINKIAKENNLSVLEDAAHALGAIYKNKPIGTISDFTSFSFQAIKHITTGDGGALCCLNDEDADRAKKMRWYGIDRNNSLPSILGEREYDITEIGYKYHMNDLAAAVGIGNLDEVPKILARRREIAAKYFDELKNVPGLTLLNYQKDRVCSFWIFQILVEKREDFIRSLKKKNIPSSVVHLRIDKNSVFGGVTPGLTNQEIFNEKQISIPIHQALSDEDVELIIKTIKQGW